MPYKMGLIFRDGAPVVYDSGDYPRPSDGAGLLRLRWICGAPSNGERKDAILELALQMPSKARGSGRSKVRQSKSCPPDELHSRPVQHRKVRHTTLAQLCAKELNISIDKIDVLTGDTNAVSLGVGTFGRIAVNAGRLFVLPLKQYTASS